MHTVKKQPTSGISRYAFLFYKALKTRRKLI